MISDGDAEAIVAEATSLLSSGQIDDGERFILKNADRLPDALKFECLGNLEFYRRNLQAAVDRFESAIGLAPERVIARYQYLVGVQEEKAGDLVQAFKRYQAAIDAEPEFLDAYVELGGLLTKVKDYEGAEKCYQAAFHLAPQDVSITYNLRAVLSELAKLDLDRYGAAFRNIADVHRKLASGRDVGPREDQTW